MSSAEGEIDLFCGVFRKLLSSTKIFVVHGSSGANLVLDLIQCRLLAAVDSMGHRWGNETLCVPHHGQMDLLERITIDPASRFGKPCGRREAELLAAFPQLCHEVGIQALAGANDVATSGPSAAVA